MYYHSSSDRLQSTVRFLSHRAFLFVLVFAAVVILFLGRADSRVITAMRDSVAQAFSGLFGLLSSPVTMVRDGLDDAQSMMLLFEENERLKEENERLRQWKGLAEKLQATVARYDALLNVQIEPEIGVITGRAIAETGGPFMRTMIVNAGKTQGVAKGQAVINERGLVGWVVGAGATSSRILLVTDLNSRIPVMIGETGERAILQGNNSHEPGLEFVMAMHDVPAGAAVMTSGDAGILPRGLPVGVVKGRDQKSGHYRVEWSAGSGPIDFVRILIYEFPKDVAPNEGGLPDDLKAAVGNGTGEAEAGGAESGEAAQAR